MAKCKVSFNVNIYCFRTNVEQERWIASHADLQESTHNVSVGYQYSNDSSYSVTSSTFVPNYSNGTEFDEYLDNTESNTTLNGTIWAGYHFLDSEGLLSADTCIYVYTAITVGTIVITLLRSITFFKVCMRASVNLHDSMFRSITRASMYFFNTNPSGE